MYQIDAETGFALHRAIVEREAPLPTRRPRQVRGILADLRAQNDVVIVDLPPMQSSSAAVRMADMVDGFVLVARWGSTPQAVLGETLSRNGGRGCAVPWRRVEPVRAGPHAPLSERDQDAGRAAIVAGDGAGRLMVG